MKKSNRELPSTIGGTPLIRLRNIEKIFALSAAVYAKLEMFNPSGSVKDRAALRIVTDAAEKGEICKGTAVIESTSGNMGISLAMLSCVFGYRSVTVMPRSASEERRALISSYGGEVILTDGGMSEAIRLAEQIKDRVKGAFMTSQFTNRSGLLAHYDTTAPEIFAQLSQEGGVDILISGVGTGGTIGGAGQYLKEKNPDAKVIAVEPAESAVLSYALGEGRKGAGHSSQGSEGVKGCIDSFMCFSGGRVSGLDSSSFAGDEKALAYSHGIEGIGAGFVPPLLDLSLIDEVIAAPTSASVELCRTLISKEGIFAGVSSGAALLAAIVMAKRRENKGKNIIVILPDRADRYLSVVGKALH